MTNPNYSREQLSNKKLNELKAIASQMGAVAADKRIKQSWIDAIVQSQPQKTEKQFTQSGQLLFERVTSSTRNFRTVYKVYCGEVELGAIGMNWGGRWLIVSGSGNEDFSTPYEAAVALEADRYAAPESQEEISAQVEPALRTGFPPQVTGGREHKASSIEVLEVHLNGEGYVVRNNENNNHYVVRPQQSDLHCRCECADCHYRGVKCKHQIAVSNFLRSRLDKLLDKPFDELNKSEWRLLGQQSPDGCGCIVAGQTHPGGTGTRNNK